MKIKLSQKYDILVDENKLDLNIPTDITGNLATFISLRPYQTNALARFQYHMGKNNPNPHLLFHMATGSGKTVLMAALILNLYSRGYRNFMFFVNSTQIIEKTKENFLNQSSTKFLFSPQITINRKPVEIRSVETFDAVNPEAINIHFTSIQRLHTRMHNPQENAVTLEDFQNRKIVMISDEAHHLNTETKNKLTNAEKIAKKSWEGTVTKIFSQNSENILLEFTATADMEHEEIL
ncbi:MAG: DEAD/DEAH box helicase family protein, partial [Rhodobacteraceae bacterium]|nr:DEAD/DEAH box helicase family protein [Paracoccaceae bacterium]